MIPFWKAFLTPGNDIEPSQEYLEKLEKCVGDIVELMKAEASRAHRGKTKPIILTEEHRHTLRRMLWDATDIYEEALDDYITRADPDKPKKRLEDNYRASDAPAFDYGADAGLGLPPWDEHYDRFYARGRGAPHSNRSTPNGPPLMPLWAVRGRVARWWRENLSAEGAFAPEFNVIEKGVYPENPEDWNPAARLLRLVAQFVNGDYVTSNCATVADARRAVARRRRRARKKIELAP